jgi:TolB-like protein
MKTRITNYKNHKSIKARSQSDYHRILAILFFMFFVFYSSQVLKAQGTEGVKPSIAVINIDCKGLSMDMKLMTSLVALELERINKFEVIDKYDVLAHLKENGIDVNTPYGKTDLIRIGKLLSVDKILSGSVEKFGDKFIVVLRIVDVASSTIEKADVMEYLDQEADIQVMIKISINNILGLPNDQNTVDMLSNFNPPISNTQTKINLNGPRVGTYATFGTAGDRLQAPKDSGGFDMFLLSAVIGYQHEVQFISSGDFQGLFEFIISGSGFEAGMFIPSFSTMIGSRFNKVGFEFGIGPTFRLVKTARGAYINNQWYYENNLPTDQVSYTLEERIDSKGMLKPSTGLIVAVGYTFRSGYLNFPINLYWSPRKDGHVVGLLCGFNSAKTKRKIKND